MKPAKKQVSDHRTVNKGTYPKVFAALQAIDLDNGAVNRIEGGPAESYIVPGPFWNLLDEAEAGLGRVLKGRYGRDDLNTFCFGEQTEQERLVAKYNAHWAHILLNAYFDDLETNEY